MPLSRTEKKKTVVEEDDYVFEEDELDAWEASLCGEGSANGRVGGQSKSVKKRLNTETIYLGSHLARNDTSKAEKSTERVTRGEKGKDLRATSEQVLDPRTRLILFKLLAKEVFLSIDGCVSTGKEANVYFARKGPGLEEGGDALAVKIYKTSILVFKDRSSYIEGEHRFRRGYSKSKNPRKMVRLWAEKEFRNYKRLSACGVPCPTARFVKGNNILVMDFLGTEAQGQTAAIPAPRLKDAHLNEEDLRSAYWQTCRAMRIIFARCKLVHADLSEYNLLWQDQKVVVIDVSQSVEHDHPRALDFLRMDCKNVNDFFGDRGRHTSLEPMSTRDLFDFVCDLSEPFATDADIDHALQKRLTKAHRLALEKNETSLDDDDDDDDKKNSDDVVFMSTFLPRSLHDLGGSAFTCEREQQGLKDREFAYQRAVDGLLGQSNLQEGDSESSSSSNDENEENDEAAGDVMNKNQEDNIVDRRNDDDDDNNNSDDADDKSDDEGSWQEEEYTVDEHGTGRLPDKPEDRAVVKERKRAATKLAKEARAEKRKTKMKKHLKKRAIKRTSGAQ